jgi:hypothetical protein
MRFCLSVVALCIAAHGASVADQQGHVLGSFEKSFRSQAMAFQVLNASSIEGAAPPLALKQRVGKSATLDHFNDKIDTVCITLAQEVQNASKCLAPAAYDLRVKSMSFQRVLEYYIMEINVFRSTWKTALKQFTDTADTFVENPLGASLLEEASMFGHKAPLDGVPRINVIDKDAAIKEFETPWEGNKKIVPDARDMNLGPNVDQTTGDFSKRSYKSRHYIHVHKKTRCAFIMDW